MLRSFKLFFILTQQFPALFVQITKGVQHYTSLFKCWHLQQVENLLPSGMGRQHIVLCNKLKVQCLKWTDCFKVEACAHCNSYFGLQTRPFCFRLSSSLVCSHLLLFSPSSPPSVSDKITGSQLLFLSSLLLWPLSTVITDQENRNLSSASAFVVLLLPQLCSRCLWLSVLYPSCLQWPCLCFDPASKVLFKTLKHWKKYTTHPQKDFSG